MREELELERPSLRLRIGDRERLRLLGDLCLIGGLLRLSLPPPPLIGGDLRRIGGPRLIGGGDGLRPTGGLGFGNKTGAADISWPSI